MANNVVAFVKPAKNNIDYSMLHFEPLMVGDVLTVPEAKPILTEWVTKFKIAAGSKVAIGD